MRIPLAALLLAFPSVAGAAERASTGLSRAVLANAGCANAVTGEQGLRAVHETTQAIAKAQYHTLLEPALEKDADFKAFKGRLGQGLRQVLQLQSLPGAGFMRRQTAHAEYARPSGRPLPPTARGRRCQVGAWLRTRIRERDSDRGTSAAERLPAP